MAAVAAELGVGWATLMRAVREFGEALVDDLARIRETDGATTHDPARIRGNYPVIVA